MLGIIGQLYAGKYTILILDGELPPHRNGLVRIEGKKFQTEIVYDLPRSIGIIGTGDFTGKEIEFI